MATSSIFASVNITTPEAAEKFARALELAEQDGPWKPDPNVKLHLMTKEEAQESLHKWLEKRRQETVR